MMQKWQKKSTQQKFCPFKLKGLKMYSLEELKTLCFLVAAAMLGRILFYRSLAMKGSFKQRVKIRLLRWLWELPVIMTIAIAAFETVVYFELRPSSGLLVAIVLGFLGLETLKVWIEDYLEVKAGCNPKRRRSDD